MAVLEEVITLAQLVDVFSYQNPTLSFRNLVRRGIIGVYATSECDIPVEATTICLERLASLYVLTADVRNYLEQSTHQPGSKQALYRKLEMLINTPSLSPRQSSS